MDTPQAVHPTDETLHAHSLGQLDKTGTASVDQHLETCPACRRRVGELSADSFLLGDSGSPVMSATARPEFEVSRADHGPTVPPAAPASPQHPGLVDHPDYELIKELGEGGMGVVYLARNRIMDRREVLKVVSSHLMNRRGVPDRFLAEIRNAAKLHHPNIVTAYSTSRVGASIVFAMEYVDGYDLSKLVKARGPLAVAHACNFVYQAALGLQYAHERGMVHRDIKPSNLIVAREGKRAVVKILDFGLAKATLEGPVDGGLTHEGQMLGTPDYIAPEQISDARRADIRADIYSLGCTLYYLLSGGPPFRGTSLYDILQAHHSMEATPLNLARPEVPVELAALVGKMMAKEPERRFQEPKDVAQALKPFFQDGGARAVAPKPELSQAARSVADQVMPQSSNHVAPVPASRSDKPASPTRPGSPLEGLIEITETEPISKAATLDAKGDRRKPGKLWPAAVAASLLGITAPALVISRMSDKGVIQGQPPTTAQRDDKSRGNARDAIANPASRTQDETPSIAISQDKAWLPERAVSKPDRPAFAGFDQEPNNRQTPERSTLVEKPAPAPPVTQERHVAEETPEERLTRLRLKLSDKFYVLEQESEVEQTFKNSLSLENQYVQLLKEKEEIEAGAARIKELEQIIAALDFEINARNQELRGRPPRPNSDQKLYYDSITNVRDEFDRQRNSAVFEVRTLRNQLPNPKQRHDLDLKIQRVYDSRRSEFRGLRELIRSTSSSYEELAKNQQVQDDLVELGRRRGAKLKLGPSPDYQKIVTKADSAAKFIEAPAATTPKASPTLEKKASRKR
jgi:serine/threonine protein kinase